MCSMIRYWIRWNKMIEEVADERIRVEDGPKSLRSVCARYNLGSQKECESKVHMASVKKASHGGGQDRVTWGEVRRISNRLEEEMWQMAQSYGYGRDAPPSL